MSFPLHSMGISFSMQGTIIMVSMRLSCFMSFSFSITILMSMRLASFMSFPPHSAGISFRMHGLIFLMNMTFTILMVSFSLHPVLMLVTGMIGMMGMTIYISFISFYMGMIMNYISMMMMGVTMFMNSCVSMSVSPM